LIKYFPENLKKTTQKSGIRRTLEAHSGLILSLMIVVAVVAAIAAFFLEASNHATLKVRIGVFFLNYHEGDIRNYELYIDGEFRGRGGVSSGHYDELAFDFVPDPSCSSYDVSIYASGSGATSNSREVTLCRGETETVYFTI
jgi:hypothetical protein